MPFLLITHYPLYSCKNVFDSEIEVIKRLNLIYDLTEGFYERRGKLDIWDHFLFEKTNGAILVIKFTSLHHKNKSFVGFDRPMKEPSIASDKTDNYLQNSED